MLEYVGCSLCSSDQLGVSLVLRGSGLRSNRSRRHLPDLLSSFVDNVPVKGDIIWYFSLTARLISLSIMLSNSIHAVAKGISSFFLSAA